MFSSCGKLLPVVNCIVMSVTAISGVRHRNDDKLIIPTVSTRQIVIP